MGNIGLRAVNAKLTNKLNSNEKLPNYSEINEKKPICEITQPAIINRKLTADQIQFRDRVLDNHVSGYYLDNLIRSNIKLPLRITPYDDYIVRLAIASCNNGDIDINKVINIECIKQYINHLIDDSLEIDTNITHNICIPIQHEFIKETCPSQYKIINLWQLIISAYDIYNKMWNSDGKFRQIFGYGKNNHGFLLRCVAVNSIDLYNNYTNTKCLSPYNYYNYIESPDNDQRIISSPMTISRGCRLTYGSNYLADYKSICDTLKQYSNAVGLIFFIDSETIKRVVESRRDIIHNNEAARQNEIL